MDNWPVKEAEARFGEMLERCLADGPQVVMRDGVEAAVLVPAKQWAERNADPRDTRAAEPKRPTLKDLLLADHPRFDFPDVERGTVRFRPTIEFDD